MYCVYLTTYYGKLLPKYYIGSTSVKKAMSGKYFGSVASKKWKEKFKNESNDHPELFYITIVSRHNTRKEALCEELKLQIKNNVVKSLDYINESLAIPNGMFGRDVNGKYNSMYGKKRPDSSERMKGDNNIAKRDDIRKNLKKPKNIINPINRTHSEETKNKMRLAALKRIPNFIKLWSERFDLKYNDFVKLLVSELNNKKVLNRQEINNILNDLNIKTINHILKKLKERGKIYSTGRGRGSLWFLKENGNVFI